MIGRVLRFRSIIRTCRRFRISSKEGANQDAAVMNWWTERVHFGSQIPDYSLYMEGYDYRGETPWKRMIAVEALHDSFLKSAYRCDITMRQFLRGLRMTAKIDLIYKSAGLKNPTGSIFLRPHRTFIRFRSLEQCRKDLYE